MGCHRREGRAIVFWSVCVEIWLAVFFCFLIVEFLLSSGAGRIFFVYFIFLGAFGAGTQHFLINCSHPYPLAVPAPE